MGNVVGMSIGAQTSAALIVERSIDDVCRTVDALGKNIESYGPDITGSAIAEFATAMESWFAAAGTLPKDLERYAHALRAVDITTAQAERVEVAKFTKITSRLERL